MRTFRNRCIGAVLAVAVFGGAVTLGCVKSNPNLSAAGQVAYTADQVVDRLQNLQTATIAAEKQGSLDRNTARIIVQFTVDAAKVLKESPAGWYPAVKKAWEQVKAHVPQASLPAVQVYWSGVDVALAAFAP